MHTPIAKDNRPSPSAPRPSIHPSIHPSIQPSIPSPPPRSPPPPPPSLDTPPPHPPPPHCTPPSPASQPATTTPSSGSLLPASPARLLRLVELPLPGACCLLPLPVCFLCCICACLVLSCGLRRLSPASVDCRLLSPASSHPCLRPPVERDHTLTAHPPHPPPPIPPPPPPATHHTNIHTSHPPPPITLPPNPSLVQIRPYSEPRQEDHLEANTRLCIIPASAPTSQP